eukprot:GHVT01012231.1.p1 GENE.GHVT01012231.1~~GHVT01012231.1.p1  ORF type:complete len:214 (+),score=20.59 GHVT01012231.1:311-952(+)
MDKYRRVEKPREATPDNEIRVTSVGSVLGYLKYAAKLFGNGTTTLVIRGTGSAMPNAVQTAELLKRTIKGLHQVTTTGSQSMAEEWEPLEEGLDKVTVSRTVCYMTITLSQDEDAVDKTAVGYQTPIDESEVKPLDQVKREGLPRVRSRRRGGARGRDAPRGQGNRGGRGGGRGPSGEFGAPTRGGRAGRGGRGRGRGPARDIIVPEAPQISA